MASVARKRSFRTLENSISVARKATRVKSKWTTKEDQKEQTRCFEKENMAQRKSKRKNGERISVANPSFRVLGNFARICNGNNNHSGKSMVNNEEPEYARLRHLACWLKFHARVCLASLSLRNAS
jgi:hypothetical protein